MSDGQELPTTSFAVLGLLTFGEMSGYDITKTVEQSIGFFWTPAKSQIYTELRRLVKAGYARQRDVEQEDRPDKRVYRITQRGQRALERWLEDRRVPPDVVRSTMLVKLFFGSRSGLDALVEQIEEVRRRAVERLGRYREIEREIRGEEQWFFPYLTLRSGLIHEQGHIRWADEVLRELKKRGET